MLTNPQKNIGQSDVLERRYARDLKTFAKRTGCFV
jgi:hypothetical protein